MYRSFIKPFGLLAMLIIAGSFIACQKEEVVSDVDNFVQLSTRGIESRFGIGRTGCYELVFPVTVQFSDSTTVDVADYAALKQAVRDWFVANGGNPKTLGKPTLVFPIQVLNQAGEVIDVATPEALRDLIALCKPVNGGGHDSIGGGHGGHHGGGADTLGGGHHGGGLDTLGGHGGGHHDGGHGGNGGGHGDPCYTLVFPVTISFPDSTQVTVNSQDEFNQAAKDWNKNNPGQHGRPELVFPVTVTLKDGTTVEVKSKEELRAIKEACRG